MLPGQVDTIWGINCHRGQLSNLTHSDVMSSLSCSHFFLWITLTLLAEFVIHPCCHPNDGDSGVAATVEEAPHSESSNSVARQSINSSSSLQWASCNRNDISLGILLYLC